MHSLMLSSSVALIKFSGVEQQLKANGAASMQLPNTLGTNAKLTTSHSSTTLSSESSSRVIAGTRTGAETGKDLEAVKGAREKTGAVAREGGGKSVLLMSKPNNLPSLR